MLINWKNASKQELLLLDGISVLTDHRRELLEFLLDPAQPRLRKRPGILRDDSWQFEDDEILVIQAALDLFSGAGHLAFWECLETWDVKNWIRFFVAVATVKNIDLRMAVALQSKEAPTKEV